jgi:phage shock protein C
MEPTTAPNTSSDPPDTGSGPPDTGSGPPGTGTQPSASAEERLHRCREGRMLAGVAAGMADYFGVDPTLVRIGFVALALLGGLAVPLYLAGWLVIPQEGADLSVAEELLIRERAC